MLHYLRSYKLYAAELIKTSRRRFAWEEGVGLLRTGQMAARSLFFCESTGRQFGLIYLLYVLWTRVCSRHEDTVDYNGDNNQDTKHRSRSQGRQKNITFNGHKEVDRIPYKYSCLPHCYLLSQAYIIPTEASADEGTAGTTLICNT